MKIVEHTERLLEITDRNRQCLWGLLLTIPFLAIGLGSLVMKASSDRGFGLLWSGVFVSCGIGVAIASLAIPIQISCKFDRPNDRVTLDKKYLLYGDRQLVIPLSTINRAEVRKSLFVRNNQPVYTIELVPIDNQKVSLAVASDNLLLYREITQIANDFLALHQQ